MVKVIDTKNNKLHALNPLLVILKTSLLLLAAGLSIYYLFYH